MIRKSTSDDYIKIIRSIQNKKLDYLTPLHVKNDIENQNQYVLEENGKIVCILSLVYDSQNQYYAMKRLCIPNKKNKGHGYAETILQYVAAQAPGKVGCTPWIDNIIMRHILEKIGFKLEYIFNEKWCYYSRE